MKLKHSISELELDCFFSCSKNFIFRVQVRVRQKRSSSSEFEFKFEFAALAYINLCLFIKQHLDFGTMKKVGK